jgi:hypothetical protein
MLPLPPCAFAPGTHKYILIEVAYADATFHFVRSANLEYHREIFAHFLDQLQALPGFERGKLSKTKDGSPAKLSFKFQGRAYVATCLGGGRAVHSPEKKTLHIYGYSKTYGRVDHGIAAGLAMQQYQYSQKDITTSDEGY